MLHLNSIILVIFLINIISKRILLLFITESTLKTGDLHKMKYFE